MNTALVKGGELLAASRLSQDQAWDLLRYRCGPAATALLDLTGVDGWFSTAPRVRPGVAVVHRPRPLTDPYLTGVDPAARRPWNVVFVEVESLRADALLAYGGRREVMPNVDRLAAGSVVFADAHTNATHSNMAVACPLCSLYPLRSAFPTGYPPDPAFPHAMIYDLLKAAGGYRVGLFSGGNEHWFGMVHLLRTPAVDWYQDSETATGMPPVGAAGTPRARWAAQMRVAGVVDDAFTVDSALRWIDAAPAGRPFFAYVNLQSSHFPYWVPPEFPRRFSPAEPGFQMQFWESPPDRAAAVRDRYDDSLRYADAQLGRLFDHLRAAGRWDHTLVMLTGDHGQAFYEHGFPTHANLPYAELVQVPLLIRAPGLPPAVDRYPAQHVDVAPSVLHLLGLPGHASYQGTDLFAADRPAHRSIYTIDQSPLAEGYSVVRDGYKLLLNLRSGGYALFDESADPGDRHDVLAAHPDLGRQLADRLDTWRAVQIGYYSDPVHQAETYAPVLPDR